MEPRTPCEHTPPPLELDFWPAGGREAGKAQTSVWPGVFGRCAPWHRDLISQVPDSKCSPSEYLCIDRGHMGREGRFQTL
eukprot:5008914-Prymnesium_polylepis.1